MNPIFKYLDYRDYLKDHYRFNKRNHRFFSFRYIARKTGIDASFYTKILNKKKHVSETGIASLIDFLKLDKLESDYFTTLVHFSKAKQGDEKNYYFDKLVSLRRPMAKTLEKDKYDYFSAWWNAVIREELNIISFKGNFDELAASLLPPITLSQARQSIESLEKLNLVRKNAAGVYKPADSFVINDGKTLPSAVRSFQKEMIDLASTAIDKIPKQDRDISTLTVSTTRACIETIQERLAHVRNEIIELVKKEENAEEVYQINFQVFPVTRNSSQKEKKQ